jgi:hypothetical protein
MNRVLLLAPAVICLTVLHLGCGFTATRDNIDDVSTTIGGSTDATGTAAGNTGASNQSVASVDTHEDPDDCSWDSSQVTHVVLNDSAITADTAAASVDGGAVTITSAGTYGISGFLTNGRVVVDTADDGDVRLILDGVDIRNSTSAPIYIASAGKAIIILADGTENRLVDGASYVLDDPEA